MVDQILCLSDRYQDCSKVTVKDETEYGDDAPDRRLDAARVLVAAKMDENQNLVFVTDIDNSLPLSDLEWIFDSLGDGGYRFFYFNIGFYEAATPYVWEIKDVDNKITQYGNILYVESLDAYYTPSVSSVTDVEPGVTSGWENSWDEFDIATLYKQVLSTKLDILTYDDTVTCGFEKCILEEAEELVDDELKSCCDATQFLKVQKMEFMLDAANSANWQQKTPWADLIVKESKKKFNCNCNCGA